jgi:hypothetical protein
MAKKNKAKPAKKPENPTTVTKETPKPGKGIVIPELWQKVIFFFAIFAGLVFMYQEPIFDNMKLDIGDLKGSGIPFDEFRVNLEETHGEPALWIPHIFGGMPFHASGSYRIRYTLETFIAALPFDHYFHPIFVFNIFFMGLFMFLFMRTYNVSVWGAFAAVVILIFTTKMFGTSHTNRIATFSMIPLILYAVRVIIQKPKWWHIFVLGAALGSQAGSYHPQVTHFTGIFLILYIGWEYYQLYLKEKSVSPLLLRSGYLAGGLVIGLMLAAIMLLPIYEYAPYSIRGAETVTSSGGSGGLSSSYATQWSLGWSEIPSLIIPGFAGFGYDTYWGPMPFTTFPNYLGILAVVFFVFFLLIHQNKQQKIFWGASFVFILMIALGRHLPPVSYFMLNVVPYYNKFREPALITILLSLVVAVTSGLFLSALKDYTAEQKQRLKKIALVTMGIIGGLMVILLIGKSFWQSFFTGIYEAADYEKYSRQYPAEMLGRLKDMLKTTQVKRFELFFNDAMRVGLVALVGLGILWSYLQNKLRLNVFYLLIIVIMLADFMVPGRKALEKQYSRKDVQKEFARGDNIAEWILAREPNTNFRIFPADESGSNKYVYYGLSSIGGYHAAKMADYQAFIEQVTFRNMNFLNMMAVKYVITERNLRIPNWIQSERLGKKYIYENENAMPLMWFVRAIDTGTDKVAFRQKLAGNAQLDFTATAYYTGTDEAFAARQFTVDSLASITIAERWAQYSKIITSNAADGFMVISEMHYPPGWRAYLNGNPLPIHDVNGGLMGLAIPAGNHTIELKYEQPSFYVAKAISKYSYYGILAILLLALLLSLRKYDFKTGHAQ